MIIFETLQILFETFQINLIIFSQQVKKKIAILKKNYLA
jgi:hypothetical protein